MKLVQKLAVVMTAAMAVSAVPVVTMAASTNRVVSGAHVIAKDDVTTAQLSIEFKDYRPGNEEFFVELTGAKFNQDVNKGGLVKGQTYYIGLTNNGFQEVAAAKADYAITIKEDKVAKVVALSSANNGNKLVLALPIKATDAGQIKVKLNANGGKSSITEGEYVLANAAEKTASLAVATGDDVKTFYDEGFLSEITLRESSVNAFKTNGLTVEIELQDTDFEFAKNRGFTIEAKYGADSQTFKANETWIHIDSKDPSRAYLVIPASAFTAASYNSLITLKINDIKVVSNQKDLDLGELKADIKSVTADDTINDFTVPTKGELDKEYKDLVVAKINEYGLSIEMKDSKPVDIVAGRTKEVEFSVKENVNDVFVDGRKVSLTLKDSEGDTQDQFFLINSKQVRDAKDLGYIITDNKDVIAKVEYLYDHKVIDVTNAKDADYNAETNDAVYKIDEIQVTFNETGVIGEDLVDRLKTESFKVKTKIYVPVSEKDTKSVDINGEFRGEKVKGTTAVNIINPFDVKTETTTVKVGLQNQPLTTIAIAETDKARFQKGFLYLGIEKNDRAVYGAHVEEIGDLTVTGDLKRTDFQEKKITDKDEATRWASRVELKRQSKSASTLTIDKALITVDRTVPEGKYDLVLSGSAIDDYDGKVVVKDYLNIGTPNTQDLAANGLAKGEAKFVIGEAKYTFNGKEFAMDAPSYIQDPGYTMVPVRYVAEAFGVKKQNILFSKGGAVTIIAGERTIQFVNGSNKAVVNGATIQLGAKTVIKDGRTYLPIGELARILGISSSWDNTTKAATFVNK